MRNVYKTLNQVYYLIYTFIILLAISCYFLNLNNLLSISVSEVTQLVFIGIQCLITAIMLGYFVIFITYTSKAKQTTDLTVRASEFIRKAKIRLYLIGFSLLVGVISLYVAKSEVSLYLIGTSAILLLLSKPNETRIDNVLSDN